MIRRLRIGDRVRVESSVGTVKTIATNSIGAELVRLEMDRGGMEMAYAFQCQLLGDNDRPMLRVVRGAL